MINDNNEAKQSTPPPCGPVGMPITVGDVFTAEHFKTAGGKDGRRRAWKVTGVFLGGTHQEGTAALVPLDIAANRPIEIPLVLVEHMLSAGIIWRN